MVEGIGMTKTRRVADSYAARFFPDAKPFDQYPSVARENDARSRGLEGIKVAYGVKVKLF